MKIILFLSITLSCFSEKAVGQSSFRYPSCSLSDSTLRPGSRIRTYSIRFAFYKDSLLAGDSTYLDSVVTFFRQHPQFFVEIGVFGSSTGSSHPDTERALAIGDYLHDKGVSLDQFICGGFGIASPLYSDADISKAASKHAQDSLRALNRRVEFIILDIRPEYRKTFTLSDSTVSDGSVFRTWDISFDTVTHCHLTENSRPVLDSVADFMKKHPQVSLSVVVHDDVWSWNMHGTDQSYSICNYLAEKGISRYRLIPCDKGSQLPISTEEERKNAVTPEQRKAIRRIDNRIEFVIVSYNPWLVKTFSLTDSIFRPGEILSDSGRIHFDLDGHSMLRPESLAFLDSVVRFMNDHPSIAIEIDSYTDQRGPDASNLALSKQRAANVMNYMIAKGIPASRLRAAGLGESNPVVSQGFINLMTTKEEKENAYAQNRRTEFKIISVQ